MIATVLVEHGHVQPGQFWANLKAGYDFIRQGNQQVLEGTVINFHVTMYHTLRLAIDATVFAALIGLPIGTFLGLGRFRGRGALRGISNGLTRIPPVVVGVLIVIATFSQTGTYPGSSTVHTFNGPLKGIVGASAGSFSIFGTSFAFTINPIVLAQTILALTVIVALTATAVQRVSIPLLEQAEVYGAGRLRLGVLALREARNGVIAALIVAFGITITAVGAVYILGGGQAACPASQYNGPGCVVQGNLAYGALQAWQSNIPMTQVAVAYAELLMAIFVVCTIVLTFLQQSRSSWIAGTQS